MKVILKQDVKGVGRKFEVKEMALGFANNFLIPKKLAEFATPEAVKRSEHLKAKAEAEAEADKGALKKQIEKLEGAKIVLVKRTNEKGHLFEQVHAEEITQAIRAQTQLEIAPEYLKIKIPIKEIGDHQIQIESGNIKGEFKLHLQPS